MGKVLSIKQKKKRSFWRKMIGFFCVFMALGFHFSYLFVVEDRVLESEDGKYSDYDYETKATIVDIKDEPILTNDETISRCVFTLRYTVNDEEYEVKTAPIDPNTYQLDDEISILCKEDEPTVYVDKETVNNNAQEIEDNITDILGTYDFLAGAFLIVGIFFFILSLKK